MVEARTSRYDRRLVLIATKRRRTWKLSTQILALQVGIVLLVVGGAFALSLLHARRNLDQQAEHEVLAIAHTVAVTPEIARAFSAREPARVIDPIAERIRRSTGAAFVVIANRQGIRYSHPNPALLGKSLLHDPGEPVASVLAGRTFVAVQRGRSDARCGRRSRCATPVAA